MGRRIFHPSDDTTTIPNFVEIVAGLEVRVGGIVVYRFRDAIFFTDARDRTRDDEKQMRSVHFGVGNFYDFEPRGSIVVTVIGEAGPILFNDYRNALPEDLKVPQLVEFLTRHRADNNDDAVLLQNLRLNAVVFDKSYIDGILSLL